MNLEIILSNFIKSYWKFQKYFKKFGKYKKIQIIKGFENLRKFQENLETL